MQQIQYFNKTFKALSNEAQFAFELLGLGVTQIQKANYTKKGIYYQSFVNLSVGLERLGKICLLLDYYISNNGTFPNQKTMKEIGHNIVSIHEKLTNIINLRNYKFHFLQSLDSAIYNNILQIISNFAIKDRYENLNFILNGTQEVILLSEWYNNVDLLLFEKHITKSKQQMIIHNASLFEKLTSNFTYILHIDEENNEISNVYTASLKTGIFDAVSKYRKLYLARIVRYYTEIIWNLQHDAMSFQNGDIPWFSEMFGCFYNEDSYLKRRNNFEI